MKRQLIEINQEFLIQCDNPECDYKVHNLTGDPYADTWPYVGKPCPECGENLLTIEDQLQAERVLKVIKWLNKWFSWLTIFIPPTKDKVGVHVHNGINIKKQ